MSDSDTPSDMEVDDESGYPPSAEGRGAAAGFFTTTVESENMHQTSVDKKWGIRVSYEAHSITTLELALQKWCCKQTPSLTLENALSLSDGSATFDVSPAPDMKMLQGLNGKILKTRDGKAVKITSIGEFQSALPVPAKAPMDEPAKLQDFGNVQAIEQSNTERSTEVPAESETCVVSVSHFWYLNHICKKEIDEILERNGVKMEPELTVAFKLQQKDGNPAKALEEFADLTRKTLSGSDCTNILLKNLDAEKLVDSLNIVKAPDNKLLLVLSSQEMTVHGPSPGCNAIRKSLASQVTSYSFCEGAKWAPSQNSSDLVQNIKDPLRKNGLPMEKSDWDQMTASLSDPISDIEAKFGVHFKGWNSIGGQFTVRAYCRVQNENPSMESHAIRALLRLYQKFVTSQRLKDTRSSRVDHQSIAEPWVAPSTGPVSNGQLRPSKAAAARGLDEGASGGKSEEEKCPICLDSFIDKKKLKCKHEFCSSCLAEAVKSQGQICPVCKDVFGTIKGDQPNGKMDSHTDKRTSLPGFEGCGHIVIHYRIPSGQQTEKHPNPGQWFTGADRTAYLPDNKEGNEVLKLLRKAFDRKLIFTVGTSRTTGAENQVTWNDIHHKTSMYGGPQCFGYPDPTYLARVKDELKSKGIV